MYLKKLLIASCLSLGLLFGTVSQADNSVVLEMAWGIGGKEMPSKGVFLRLRHDKIEAHVGQWIGSAGEKNVVGLGYVMQVDRVTWTPGIAYMKDSDMVMFNRLAWELPVSETGAFEVGLLGYGTYDNWGETFATAAFKVGRNSSYVEDNENEGGVVAPEGDNNTGGDNDDGDGGSSGGDGGNNSGGSGGGDGSGNGNNDGDSDGGGEGSDDGDHEDEDDSEGDNGEQCERPGHGYGDVNNVHCFGYKM